MNADQHTHQYSFDWIPASIEDVWDEGLYELCVIEIIPSPPRKVAPIKEMLRRTARM